MPQRLQLPDQHPPLECSIVAPVVLLIAFLTINSQVLVAGSVNPADRLGEVG
ncbi:MAG TPA: hypothetical protein VKR32_04855 [Puia sp.]|nr:hypothetical protein [Puia sp.]